MLGFCRVFSDIKVTIFSRLTMEMLIGFAMCIFLIVQCSKKKGEKSTSKGSKETKKLDQSIADKSDRKKRSKDKALDPRKSGEDVQKSKNSKKSGKSQDGKKTKTKDSGSKRSGKTGDGETKSQNKQSGGSSKPMDGTQNNGPTPNDPTNNNQQEDLVIQYDSTTMPMDKTIEELDNPAVHERVTRLAATDMIFDPKKVAYMGNVDNDKDDKEQLELGKELDAACEKHEARFKDIRKLEERDPHYRRPKSTESEKSMDKKNHPVPADQRIKLRPDQCVLFETKDLLTEDDEELQNNEDGSNTNK